MGCGSGCYPENSKGHAGTAELTFNIVGLLDAQNVPDLIRGSARALSSPRFRAGGHVQRRLSEDLRKQKADTSLQILIVQSMPMRSRRKDGLSSRRNGFDAMVKSWHHLFKFG